MANIEISLEEYNSYHDTINRLHKEKFELMKKIGEKDVEIDNLKENIEIVKSTSWFDRIFEWKQIKKLISK